MSWTIERRGRVAVVTMTTNPVNAQNQAFFADLHDAFDRLERDHADSPVVLTGTGRRFSAGLDLDEHFRLFAGDPAAVGSWFAGYRATKCTAESGCGEPVGRGSGDLPGQVAHRGDAQGVGGDRECGVECATGCGMLRAYLLCAAASDQQVFEG